MKFSVCIPNYNYERYLGRTIQSVLDQSHPDFEILVSDNASTDRSVEIARGFGDPRIQVTINACNVGFAANLDRAARMASGDWMLMLSSDDMLRPNALATYQALFDALGTASQSAVASAAVDVIDADDHQTGRIGPQGKGVWIDADRAPELDKIAGGPVYRVAARELLRRSVLTMQNPFHFATAIYPRPLYQAVEGYGAGRLINPDKWFHWKLLARAETAYFIDRPLAAYRWHASNQTAQQAGSGALKYLVDEYVSTFELDAAVLKEMNLSRDDVERAFVEFDIGRHGLAVLAKGQPALARRVHTFGKAAYPRHVGKNRKARALRALLALGPVAAYKRVQHTLEDGDLSTEKPVANQAGQ